MSEARWIVAIAGLVVCVATAYYIAKLFRDMALGKTESPSSYISDFQRLREEGKLDDEEYEQLTKAIPTDKSPVGMSKDLQKAIKEEGNNESPDFTVDKSSDEGNDDDDKLSQS